MIYLHPGGKHSSMPLVTLQKQLSDACALATRNRTIDASYWS